MEAAAGDLQAVMTMLSSSQMEVQSRLLRAGNLLDEMRRAVADVHGALTATGATSTVALAARTRSAYAYLRDALEAVLAMGVAATAGTLFRAIFSGRHRRRRGAIIRDLRQSLHHLRELSSLASTERSRSFLRYDSLEIERAVRANTVRDALAEPMVGRSELAEKMMRVLLAGAGAGKEDGPLVMPIVGGPGIGKTHLAQALFNDTMVMEKFPVRRWENVSESSDLFKRIVPNMWFQNFLDEFIDKPLRGQKGKYLIVLDDVWNANEAQDWPEWDSLMRALPSNGTVIFTTRTLTLVSKTAAVVPRTLPYFLQPLQQEHTIRFVHQCLKRCWLDRSSELFNIGMQIASKCDGVPLLLQSAGSILCRRPEAAFWQQFLEDFDVFFEGSRLYSSDEERSEILESAYSSYKHLPSHLQSCFLYCSMFPLGFSFDAEELADLFAAAALMPLTITGAQRIGFLEQLLTECFYPIEDSEYGGKPIYRMHKILHIFAVYMERELSTVMTADKDFTQVQPSVRLMSLIISPSTASFPRYIDQLVHLKALILLQDSRMCLSDQRCEIKEIDPVLCQSLEHLQVLSLQATKISKLPNKIELVPHLRYLNLSQTNIETIPSSISKLQLLQTLILSHCEKLRKLHENICKLVQLQKLDLEGCHYLGILPTKMSKMKSLEYLNVLNCSSLTAIPRAMGQLTHLHTLLGYFVPSNGSSAMLELQSLPDLNRLSLVNLEKVLDTEDARMAKLQEKEKLELLMLRWNVDTTDNIRMDHGVLENLQPNQCLKTLEIVAYEGYTFPSWMTRTEPYLTSLVEIRLVNMRACEKALPPLGLLPCLKIAEISGVDNISSIDDNFYGHNGTFPSLEKLILSYMTSLEVWEQSSRMNLFPRLAELVIIQCPKLRALHMELPSAENLISWMNNKMLYSSKEGLRGVEKSLENLSISFCEELHASSDCEGLQALGGLKKLEICGCHELSCLPQGLQHLSSLTSLKIDNCNKLEILPEWLENLPYLQIMCLSGCPILHSIPEGRLTCIDVIVEHCPNLENQ